MNSKVSVVIRNKNQSGALEFLLKNLNERYKEDIDEIIVIDNLSVDGSTNIIQKYGAKLVTIEKFSYGGSANLAAECSSNSIIVVFSAHAYPVSHDFFKQIVHLFRKNEKLAGLRCLHNPNDYRNYINRISSKEDPNKSSLIFCGSAFNKKVWELHRFKEDIKTFEDKEWSLRVLKEGFEIEFSPSIFCYDLNRTKQQNFFRFKNEIIGSYQLWHREFNYRWALKALLGSIFFIFKNAIMDLFYAFKRFLFMLNFISDKPQKF
jgi:glycosyltransferase involved in cell wall biosynthesis